MEVAIELDLPQPQIVQLRMEYWRMQDQDNLASLHIATKGKAGHLWKLYKELVIRRGLSYDKVANLVDIALNKLPYAETLYEQAKRAADRQQERLDYLEYRTRTFEEAERSRKGIITLRPSSYHYANDRENPAANTIPYYPASNQPSSSPNGSLVNYDTWSEKWTKQEKSRETDEIDENV